MEIIVEAAIRCDAIQSPEAYVTCVLQMCEALEEMEGGYPREAQTKKIPLPKKVREEVEKDLESFAPGNITLYHSDGIMYFCRIIV